MDTKLITRRDLFKGLAIATLPTTNITSARAQAGVGTAIQIVKFAIGAAELFGKSPTTDSSRVLVSMIANLSKQLEVVQEGMQLMLSNIARIEQMLGDVPQLVVQEISSANLQASVLSYDELLRVRAQYGTKHNSFLRERRDEVNKLIDRVRQHRDVLIQYENTVNIPIVATALAVEYGLMRLARDNGDRIIPALESYQKHFKEVLYEGKDSLEMKIKRTRDERQRYLKENFESPQVELTRAKVLNTNFQWINIGYSMHSAKKSDEIAPTVAELVRLGLIEQNEMAVSVDLKYDGWSPDRSVGPGVHKSLCCPHKGSFVRIAKFPKHSSRLPELEQMAVAKQEAHNLIIDKLYAYVTSMHAGTRALAFTQRFV